METINYKESKLKELIENKNLFFLPWLQNSDLLIVAESHYRRLSDKPLDSNCTVECITESQYNHEWESKTYQNLVQLFCTLQWPRTQEFFDNINYHNLVQREMEPLIAKDGKLKYERPNAEDIKNGLFTLFSVVEIIKPKAILFASLIAKKYLNSNEHVSDFQEYEKISSSIPASFNLTTTYGTVPCLMIRHPGSFFSVDAWREFIVNHSPNFSNLLSTMNKANIDSLSTEKKNELFVDTLSSQLNNIYRDFIVSCDVSLDLQGAEGIYFHLKGTDLQIAFEFWNKGYQKLTAGIYNPQGGFKHKLSSEEKSDGWKQNKYYTFYEFYQEYCWRDTAFRKIQDGSMAELLMNAVDYLWKQLKVWEFSELEM